MRPKQASLDLLAWITHERRALDRRERLAVTDARAAGATWQEIADALGVSRQAAHRRYRTVDRPTKGTHDRPGPRADD